MRMTWLLTWLNVNMATLNATLQLLVLYRYRYRYRLHMVYYTFKQYIYIYIYLCVCMYNFYLNKLFKFFILLKEIIIIIKILFSNYILSFGYHTKYV